MVRSAVKWSAVLKNGQECSEVVSSADNGQECSEVVSSAVKWSGVQ